MKKIVLLSGILVFAGSVFAQKEVSIVQHKVSYLYKMEGNMERLDGPYKEEPLFYTKGIALEDGKVNIYNRLFRSGMINTDRKSLLGLSVSSGLTLVPAVQVVSFDAASTESSNTLNNIHLFDAWNVESPYSYQFQTPKMDKLGDSDSDIRLSELKNLFPKGFEEFNYKPQQNVYFSKSSVGATYYTTEQTISKFSIPGMVPQIETNKKYYQVDLKSMFDKFSSYSEGVHNTQLDQWTTVVGQRLKGKENKRSEYYKLNFITTDNSGKILNDVLVDYKFAQNFQHHQFVPAEDPGNSKIVYFSSRRPFMKKYNNPDETIYDLVVFNQDGSKDLHHKFSFGSDSYELKICHAYIHNDNLFLIGINNYGKGNLILFEVDENGVKQVEVEAPAIIGNKELKVNADWINYGSKIVNGNLFIWGEQKDQIKERRFEEGEWKPEIVHYKNFAVIEVDPASKKIVGQYVFNKENLDITKPVDIEEVIEADGKLIFHIPQVKRTKSATDIAFGKLNFYKNLQYAQSGIDFLEITRPMLFSVDYKQKKNSIYQVSDPDYVNLYPSNSYLREGDNLYYVGIHDDNTAGEVVYKVVKVDLNQ